MSTETIDIVVKESGSAAAATGLRGVGTAAKATSTEVSGLNSSVELLKTTLASLGIAFGLSTILGMTQAYLGWNNTLRQATSSAGELAVIQQKLFDISQLTHTSVSSNVQAYNEFESALKNTTHTAQETLDIIKNLDSFFTASGKSAEDASGLVGTLAFAMSSGTVAGRPLMQVMRESKDLTNALAESLGVTVPRFKELADAGQITTGKLVDMMTSVSFTKAATEALGKVQVTVAQATQNLSNAFTAFVGKLDTTTGASSLLARGILLVAGNIPILVAGLEALGAAWVAMRAVAIASLIQVRIATIATTLAAEGMWAALTGGLTLIIPALAAAVVWVMNFGQSIKLTEDGTISLRGAVVGTFNYMVGAIQAAARGVVFLFGQWVALVQLVAGPVIAGFVQLYNVIIATTNAIAGLYPGSLLQELVNDVLTAARAVAALWTEVYQGSLLKVVVDAIADAFGRLKTYIIQALTALHLMSGEGIGEFGLLKQSILDASKEVPVMKAQFDTATFAIREGMQQATKGTTDWAKALADAAAAANTTANSASTDFARIAASANSASSAISGMSRAAGGVYGAAEDISGFLRPGVQGSGHGGFSIATPGHLDSGSNHFATGGSFMVGGQGGTDSQLVQFMASPNERVKIETPDQQKSNDNGGGKGVTVQVQMNVTAKDADSFNLSRKTIVMGLQSELSRALRSIG